MEYEELSEKAIASAKGNPLALKVLGSYFHSKSKDTWECELKKLKKYPNKEIQNVLSLSYDGLDDLEKKLFLDVAFFFKEEDKDYVTKELDDIGFYGTSGIKALQQKALLTISSDNKIQMHDLIQGMGWEIVRQESIAYPGRRSRLRDNDEVYDVLKNNRGTHAVEAIQIDISHIRDLSLSADTFRKMPNLRFLKIYCPLHVEPFVPPSYDIEFLRRVQDFLDVKKTDLSQSKLLVELPKLLYKTSILERANPKLLHNLVQMVVPQNISVFTNLDFFSLDECNTTRLIELPHNINIVPQLRVLELHRSSVEGLPTSINLLRELEKLSHRGDMMLQSLPEFPPSIKFFDVSGCILLGTVELILNTAGPPGLMGTIYDLSQLSVLILDGSSVERLPTDIKLLQKLKELSLRGCRRLQSLPELPPSIEALDASNCTLLKTVEFSLNTSGSPDLQYAYISFRNCVRLDGEKFNYSFHQFVRALAYGYGKTRTRAQEMENLFISPLRFCYRESKVPKWFRYRTWGASITVELVLSTDLFSCLLCIVMSPSSCFLDVSVTCQSYIEDGNMPGYRYEIQKKELHNCRVHGIDSEHAYITYSEYCGSLFREIKAGRVNDYCTSFSYKVTLLFSFEVLDTLSSDPEHKMDGLIKECGVCPLYHSDYHNFIKTNRHPDVFALEALKLETKLEALVTRITASYK